MKYSAELIAELCKHLGTGFKREDACTLVNIGNESFYQWMNGNIPEEAYAPKFRKKAKPLIPIGDGTKQGKEAIRLAYAALTEWEDGRSAKQLEFPEAIKSAELNNKGRSMAIIQNASMKSWQAAAWWLERKYKDEFAQRVVNEHEGKVGFMAIFQNEQTTNTTNAKIEAGQ